MIELSEKDAHKPHHSDDYQGLTDVEDYKYSTMIRLWNELLVVMQNKTPGLDVDVYLRNLAIFSAMYLTGNRASEIANMDMKDISFEDNWIYVRSPNQKNKKQTRKEIVADLTIENTFIKYLVKYYNYRLKDCLSMDEPLFISSKWQKRKKKRISRLTIYNLTTKYLNFNPHFMRKLRASHLVEYFGFDGKALQQYIGWACIQSSEDYVRLSKDRIKQNFIEHSDRIERIVNKVKEVEKNEA